MAQTESATHAGPTASCGFGGTERKDPWWIGPLVTALVLGSFVIYATFRAFFNAYYRVGEGTGILEDHAYLLSPFYSPLLVWEGIPAWLSPALFILWAPGGFRLTCYYYRKAYYRAFFVDPPACAVGEPGSLCGLKRGLAYKGETRLLLFQNLHRFFLYFALLFLVLLALDVVHSCIWPTAAGGHRFGVSVGTLVLAANVTFLSLYTFSCHSLRHLVGGRLDSFSRSPTGRFRHKLWVWASKLNRQHMLWAWTSLFGVAFADFYVWLVAARVLPDVRIL
jgi:hypothetical protein